MRKLAREISEQKMATGQSKLTEGLNKSGEKTCARKVKKMVKANNICAWA